MRLTSQRAERCSSTIVIVALAAALLSSVRAYADLPPGIARVLDSLEIPATDVSIVIEAAGADTPLLSHMPEVSRNPASVMKIVTTWSAIETLGPAWVWPTEVYFLGSFDGSTLNGDLGLKGYGDPFLVQEELWKLLRRLRSAGLERIAGDLVFDDSYFDVREPPAGEFDAQPTRTYNVVPNALLMNFKAVQFQFRPDTIDNTVRVALEPPLRNLRIDNNIDLGNGRCGGYQRGISFNVGADDPGRVVLDGEFSRNCRVYSMSRTVLEHDTYAEALFRSIWGEIGGRIDGRLRREAIAQDSQPSLVWSSRPLAEVVRSINKNSNNVMTRQLLYTISAHKFGAPGTRENGVAAIVDFLQSRGLNTESLTIVNGAGLSRESRVSAQLLVDLLQASLDGPYAAEFVASLSIGGIDGTTRGRYDSRSGNGRLHLKTGRIDHVSAIAGFAHHDDGTDYAFSVIVNTPEAHRGLGQEVEAAVLSWLFTQ